MRVKSIIFEQLVLWPSPVTRVEANTISGIKVVAVKDDQLQLSLSNWVGWAAENLMLSSEIATLYFEAFQLVDDRAWDPRWGDRNPSVVPFLPFLLFLYCQRFGGASVRAGAAADVDWPAATPDGAGVLPASTAELRHHAEVARCAFVTKHIEEIVGMLSDAAELGRDADPSMVVDALTLILSIGEATLKSVAELGAFVARGLADSVVPRSPDQRTSSTPLLIRGPEAVIGQLTDDTLHWGEESVASSVLTVHGCAAANIYVTAAVRHATITGCHHCTVFIGAVSGAVTISKCKRVTLVTCCRQIVLGQATDCTVYASTPRRPVLLGEVRRLVLAPHASGYSGMPAHLAVCGLDGLANRWDEPLALIEKGPHAATFSLLPPRDFFRFAVPFGASEKSAGGMVDPAVHNGCGLPDEYRAALEQKSAAVAALRKDLAKLECDDNTKARITDKIQRQFCEWLADSGNGRQLADLVRWREKKA